MGNKYYKKYIRDLINQDPTEATIIRQVKTPDGYGGHTLTPVTITHTIRLYDARRTRETVTDAGKSYTSTIGTKALAEGSADLQEGDQIKAKGKTYRVAHLNNYFNICKQAELEAIK